MLSNLNVVCPLFHGDGCKWQGSYDAMLAHVRDQCGYLPLVCEYCQSRHQRSALGAHKNGCTERPSSCDYCHHRFPLSTIPVHQTTCTERPVTCEVMLPQASADAKQSQHHDQKGCGQVMPYSRLLQHQSLSGTCTQTLIKCAIIGCNNYHARQDAVQHASSAALTHVQLLSAHMEIMKHTTAAMFASMQTDITELKQQLKKMMNPVAAAASASASSATSSPRAPGGPLGVTTPVAAPVGITAPVAAVRAPFGYGPLLPSSPSSPSAPSAPPAPSSSPSPSAAAISVGAAKKNGVRGVKPVPVIPRLSHPVPVAVPLAAAPPVPSTASVKNTNPFTWQFMDDNKQWQNMCGADAMYHEARYQSCTNQYPIAVGNTGDPSASPTHTIDRTVPGQWSQTNLQTDVKRDIRRM